MTTTPSATLTADDIDPIFFLAATDPAAMAAMNTELVAGFRATNGQLGGAFAGVPLLLLTSTGARTGARSTTPMNYTRTYAHLRGASDRAIAHQTRHRSLATLGMYVRIHEAWEDNAATMLGL